MSATETMRRICTILDAAHVPHSDGYGDSKPWSMPERVQWLADRTDSILKGLILLGPRKIDTETWTISRSMTEDEIRETKLDIQDLALNASLDDAEWSRHERHK
ncbi:MAG: hypothetical protein WC700_14925 [Gemmatimonadaceae bacterium]|jgi:hypothetical protein